MIETLTLASDWAIILPVVFCLVGAALLLMTSFAREFHFGLALVVVGAVIASDVMLVAQVLAEGPVAMTMGKWLPPFGISFAADLMAASFALAAGLVTLVLLVYMQMDLPERAKRDGIYPLVLLLLAGVSGSFLTGDLFNLYVWFEVMLIASFGLMVLGGRALQLDGTVKYGFLNFLATTFFLLALGLLYGLIGTLNMADIAGVAGNPDPAAMTAVAALFLLAFGMKAAAFPVNAWLPASYHAPPAAISALLAGLLTKVGVYALLRTMIALLPGSREVLEPVLMVVAVLTLLIAPLGAIAETNLRRALGFLVIGGIGATIAGIAVSGPDGVAGSAMYIFHAMLTMTGLYLVAGLIEKLTGEIDTKRMGGLYGAASLPSIAFFILMLAVAGVPPFLGFWPKLLLLEGALDASGIVNGPLDWGGVILAFALLLNALLTLIAGSRLWGHIFLRAGQEGALSETPNPDLRPLTRRENWFGLMPTLLLTLLILGLGLLPGAITELGQSAARDLLDPARYISAVGLAP